MTDKELEALGLRLTAGALAMTAVDASPGSIAMACLSIIIATDGLQLTPDTTACVGHAVDRAIAYRSAQRDRAGKAVQA